MSNIKKALTDALNFIESVHSGEWSVYDSSHEDILILIESALAELEKCEPVAWGENHLFDILKWSKLAVVCRENSDDNQYTIPLYTSPISKEWVSLTDADISDIHVAIGEEIPLGTISLVSEKLKQLNTKG